MAGDTRTKNELIVLKIFDELWRRPDPSTASELFAPDYRSHDWADSDPLFAGGVGPGGVLDFIRRVRSASSDLCFELVSLESVADLVIARWAMTGTHTGPLGPLAPTGRLVRVEGTVLYRIRGGRIVEGWHWWDYDGALRQLGVRRN